MKRVLFDTCMCLAYLQGKDLYQDSLTKHNLSDESTVVLISVVTKAELLSLGLKNGWGAHKLQKLQSFLHKLVIIDIQSDDKNLLNVYAEIDAFSQGRLQDNPLPGGAKNMGKNDLWIAATAFVTKAALLTKDNDFDHLNGKFLTVLK